MQHTARSAEFMEKEGRAKAISTCKLLGLDGIVVIGGYRNIPITRVIRNIFLSEIGSGNVENTRKSAKKFLIKKWAWMVTRPCSLGR